MNNKVFRLNFSGLTGLILLIVIIALGFLALTFFAVFIGVIVVLVIAGFIIRKFLGIFGLKQKTPPNPPQANQDKEYFRGRVIEIPEYKVEDEDKE